MFLSLVLILAFGILGGIALSEGLACGTLVLTAAVISILVTAPLGALLVDFLRGSYK